MHVEYILGDRNALKDGDQSFKFRWRFSVRTS